MPKVSVLVAVYNAAPFLPQCLDSLRNQTLRDIQVICIDDASTDGSLRILNDYARQDTRFEVIHLEHNQGQAHARNEGLRMAKGDYVCMLDADDWFSVDALENAVAVFDNQTDCVLFDLVMHNENHEEVPYPTPAFDSLPGREAFLMSLRWQVHGLYMVRRSIHLQYPYDETCLLYSDDNTTRLHYLASRLVRRCVGRYYYRQHALSATHAITVRRFDYLRANESMRRQMQQAGIDEETLALYENHRWLNIIDVYMFYHVHSHELSAEERHYGQSELRWAWGSIDRLSLKKETTVKFGYRPFKYWWLFSAQEWLYFTLRGMLGRNR